MKIALVLGSGSAKGYAHIGVIEELKRRGHSIVAVSGTSMGAIIGGLEAAGGLEAFTEWARSLSQFDVLRTLDFALGRGGVVKADRIIDRLDEFCGGVRIEDLPIPYTAVATDLTARREVWFQRGPLVQAMRASMSMPGFITPVMLGSHILVDGAVLNPVPVEPTLSVPADMTIAVALHGYSDTFGAQILADAADVESAADTEPEQGESEAFGRRLAARVAAIFTRDDEDEEDAADGTLESENELQGHLDRLEATLASYDEQSADEQGEADTAPSESAEAGTVVDSAADLLVHAEGSISMSSIMEQALATMEDRLERLRGAMSPVHLRIEVPEDVCRSLDFHRAGEVIEAGRELAIEAFDKAGL